HPSSTSCARDRASTEGRATHISEDEELYDPSAVDPILPISGDALTYSAVMSAMYVPREVNARRYHSDVFYTSLETASVPPWHEVAFASCTFPSQNANPVLILPAQRIINTDRGGGTHGT